MKIIPASQTLSLILEKFQTTILPELRTEETKDAANLIQAAVTDLLRRQGPGVNLLKDCLKTGKDLESEIHHFLEVHAKSLPSAYWNHGATETAKHNGTGAASGIVATQVQGDFEALAEEYENLTQEIHALCVLLASTKENINEAASLLRKAAEWEAQYYRASSETSVVPFGDLNGDEQGRKTKELSKEFLQEFLSERHGPLEIESFSTLPGGYGGKQTFYVTVVRADGEKDKLVIRKTDAVPAISHSLYNLEEEYSFLKCLEKTDFPAPHPIDLCLKGPLVDGTFYTMPHLPGKVPGTWLGGGSQEITEELLFQLAELMAKFHRISPSVFANHLNQYDHANALNETISDRYRRNLAGWQEYAARVEHLPSPFVKWLFHWLERNIPDDKRTPIPIHGDFFVHNTLVDTDGRITAVLDWECADLGAPEQDLAYVQPHVSKYMDWDKFLAHYLESGGQQINPNSFGFCFGYAIMRIFLAGNRSSMNLQRGITRDLRFLMMELGFAGALMKMGLGCAA